MRVLRWFGHVERMSGEKLTKRVCEKNVGGRPPKGWMNGVKDAVEKIRMIVENAKVVCQNRSEWRAIVCVR